MLDYTLPRVCYEATRFRVGAVPPSALTPAESYRYFLLLRLYWISMQNVHTQNKLNVFDPGVWAGYLNIICNDLRSPGMRSGWQSHRSYLSPEFVDVVEDCSTF